jgi:CPA2 family monovalent cation:H+ antiporter-2
MGFPQTMPLLAAGEAGPSGSVFELLTIVLLAAVVVALIFHRFRQSVLIGYFLCGILIGPDLLGGWLGFVKDISMIEAMADIGVILLMFTIGIEFSFGQLKSLRRVAMIAAPIQILGSAAVGGLIAIVLNMTIPQAILVAVIIAISSTAIVLRLFQDMSGGVELATRISIGIAIIQDIVVVAFMIILPKLFGASEGTPAMLLLEAVGKGIIFLGICWLLNRYVLPNVLRWVSNTKSRELFTLAVLGLCVGIAELSYLFGLGFAMGAFMAGLLVSETVYSHKIMADILPFKDFFLTLFFVSVGMLMDVQYLLANWWLLLLTSAAVIVVKAGIAFAGALISKHPVRQSLMAALGLSCIGEFSFVMLREANNYNALSDDQTQFLTILAIMTMSVIPVLIKFSVPISRVLEKIEFLRPRHAPPTESTGQRIKGMKDHAIICGFGPIGRYVTDTANHMGISTLVIELNAATVDQMLEDGQCCLYADATQSLTMELAHLERARILAITFPGFDGAQKIVQMAKSFNTDVLIMARARFPNEAEQLSDMGVHVVVHEESATADAMVRKVLAAFEVDEDSVEDEIQRLHFEKGV